MIEVQYEVIFYTSMEKLWKWQFFLRIFLLLQKLQLHDTRPVGKIGLPDRGTCYISD